MNISHSKYNNDLLFINFNQDFTCVSVGTTRGYQIFNCYPFSQSYSIVDGGTSIVETLFYTSFVAIVGTGEQPTYSSACLEIVNIKQPSMICELKYPTAILAVKMNRRRLIVVLEDRIFLYDISNMKLLHTIDTSPNPRGICALSPSSENCYLVYPCPFSTSHIQDSNFIGDVEILDALTLKVMSVVQAVSNIAINSYGTLLATASEKGTIIRVMSIPDANKVYQFRHDSSLTQIVSMTFGWSSSLLCVSGPETVYIFKLGLDASTKSFASLKLPKYGLQNLVALSSRSPLVLVITEDGNFYQYNIDLVHGGECSLLVEYSLVYGIEESTVILVN